MLVVLVVVEEEFLDPFVGIAPELLMAVLVIREGEFLGLFFRVDWELMMAELLILEEEVLGVGWNSQLLVVLLVLTPLNPARICAVRTAKITFSLCFFRRRNTHNFCGKKL